MSVGLLLLIAPGAARADSYNPSDECAAIRGSTADECTEPGDGGPDSSGGHPFTESETVFCVPFHCKTDADCADIRGRCMEVATCMDGGRCGAEKKQEIQGECDDQDKCGGTAVCKHQNLCVTPRFFEKKDDCAVRAPGALGGSRSAFAAAVLAFGVLLRRRRAG